MPNVHEHEGLIPREHAEKWKYRGVVIFTNDVPIVDAQGVARIHENRTHIEFKCEAYTVYPRHGGKTHDELCLFNAVTTYIDHAGKPREWVHHHLDFVTFGGGGQFAGGTQTDWKIEEIKP